MVRVLVLQSSSNQGYNWRIVESFWKCCKLLNHLIFKTHENLVNAGNFLIKAFTGFNKYFSPVSLQDPDHQFASHRLCVQNDLWSFAIFSAIEQLVMSSLVLFRRLGPYLFNNYEKKNMMKANFRDIALKRCFKYALADLEMFLEVSMHTFPKSLYKKKKDIQQEFFHSSIQVFSPRSMIKFQI